MVFLLPLASFQCQQNPLFLFYYIFNGKYGWGGGLSILNSKSSLVITLLTAYRTVVNKCAWRGRRRWSLWSRIIAPDLRFLRSSDNGLITNTDDNMSQYVYIRHAPRGHESEEILRSDTSVCHYSLRWAVSDFLHQPGSCRSHTVLLSESLWRYQAVIAATHHHRKVKTDHSVATLGKNSRLYDVTTSKKYEVESAPLTSDECLQVKQLFTLPTVRIPFDIYSVLYGTNFDALTTILITDFTSEISDTNEKTQHGEIHIAFCREPSKSQHPNFARHIFNDKFQPPFS